MRNIYIRQRAFIYSFLFYYLPWLKGIHSCLKDKAIHYWNEWYEENLNEFIKRFGKYQKGTICIVFRCRTPFTNRSEVHLVWLPPDQVINLFNDYEFSQLKIILGPKLIEDTFERCIRNHQDSSFLIAPSVGFLTSGQKGLLLRGIESGYYYWILNPIREKSRSRGKYKACMNGCVYPLSKFTGLFEMNKYEVIHSNFPEEDFTVIKLSLL